MSSETPSKNQPPATPGDAKPKQSAMQANPVQQQTTSGRGNQLGAPVAPQKSPDWSTVATPAVYAVTATPNGSKNVGLPTDASHKTSLEAAKDIDGVRLIRSNRWLSEDTDNISGLINPGVFLSPNNSDSGNNQRTPLQVGTHPPPIPKLDPNRYRLLVQGSAKLLSKLSRRGAVQQLSSASGGTQSTAAAQKGTEKAAKRKVQFSDESGYDLYIMRSIDDLDQMPDVPAYATAFLKVEKEKEKVHNQEKRVSLTLKPCKFKTLFTQPGMMPDFQSKVENNKIALQFCLINEDKHQLSGTIRVLNVGFHKKVTVILTYDQWKTTREVDTFYVHYSSDGVTDLFKFEVNLPAVAISGSQIQFIARYNVEGHVYWDNNMAMNYIIACNGNAL